MDKLTLLKNFSRYAHLYDRYSDVQKRSSFRLLKEIKPNGFRQILELGCGTGNYTFLLRKGFKVAHLVAVDICAKMLGLANEKLKKQSVEFINADAEDIEMKAKFDLITSNASFQWFTDLEKAILKYKEMLNPGGLLAFSIFGPLTFWELNRSLSYILKDVPTTSSNFMAKEKLQKILRNNFKVAKVREIKYQESFQDIQGLLEKIKYSGIRGNGIGRKIYFNRRHLRELEKAYLDKFGEIRATYQVFFCQGYNL